MHQTILDHRCVKVWKSYEFMYSLALRKPRETTVRPSTWRWVRVETAEDTGNEIGMYFEELSQSGIFQQRRLMLRMRFKEQQFSKKPFQSLLERGKEARLGGHHCRWLFIKFPMLFAGSTWWIKLMNGCLIMLCMFGYSVMKDLDLLAINLLAAFTDALYRLVLQTFGIYRHSWLSYPLNALFSTVVFGNSFIIARHIAQGGRKKEVLKVTCLLGLQFFLSIPATLIVVYTIFPWYSKGRELEKVFIAGVCPLIVSIPKVLARSLVLKLDCVHPGVLHLLVGCLYSSSAIVFRVVQAELTSFKLFVALGVGHAFIDLIERLTITMRDYIWQSIFRLLVRCNRTQSLSYSARHARTPRSMRFVADVSIQLLLTEPTALVSAVGLRQVYKFMFSDISNRPSVPDLVWGFLERCATGLAIDVVFNTVSLWLQVRVFNIAVLKVWNSKNWHAHFIANIVFTLMSILYFTGFLFVIIRTKNDPHTPIRFTFNCSLPFSPNK
ncbi:uncharacterized protein LOC141875447 [Acropora palmata]|uniref:uncharacterized protein LOC141875447 n=1 Tax=Acropora palmata TaxID=6131 RepID=UPI003DA0D373